MAKKKAWVTDVNGNGWAQVVIDRGDTCNHCEASEFCHSISNCSKMKTKVLNKADATVGDLVAIELNSKTLYKSAFVLYLVPAIGLLAGAISGDGLSENLSIEHSGLTIVLAFAGLAMGFAITIIFSHWMSAKKKLTPVITTIVKHQN